MITILAFLLVFTIIAIAHEFGHCIIARRNGIDVYEFSLGLGPRIFGITKGKTTYSINLLPFAGYVKIAGIDPANDLPNTPEENKYYTKSVLKKFSCIVAGSLANLMLGAILLSIIFMFFGQPAGNNNIINSVNPGSEAEKIGLLPGDKVISINDKPTNKAKEIIAIIRANNNQKIYLTAQRNAKTLTFVATPRYDAAHKFSIIGITLTPTFKKLSPIHAATLAIKETVATVIAIISLVGQLIMGKFSLSHIAGPIGIAQISGEYASGGILSLLSFIAFFSINVGTLNLLPIPALDGGRLVFIFIEALRRKPISIQIENKIHYWGMAFLLALMAVISANDLFRIFQSR